MKRILSLFIVLAVSVSIVAAADASEMYQLFSDAVNDGDAAAAMDLYSNLQSIISKDYQNISQPLLIIGVLKGSFIFLADLCRKLSVPHVVDFIAISSYGSGGDQQGNVRMLMDIRENMAGRDVLIVEDILDDHVLMNWRFILAVRDVVFNPLLVLSVIPD